MATKSVDHPAYRLRRRALVLPLLLLAVTVPATKALSADDAATNEYAIHNYTVKLRAAVWGVSVDGGIGAQDPINRDPFTAQIDDDFGYDGFYPTFHGEAAFRYKRHDFKIIGTHFNEDESAPINVSFEIEGGVFDVGGEIKTEIVFTDINFRYGYSFFTYEENGFRLGPTLGVSYTRVEIDLLELQVGGIGVPASEDFSEEVPVPELGLNVEVPWGPVLLSGQAGGFYYDSDAFSAKGLRTELSATWRPYDNLGIYFGLNATYIDIELRKEDINDVWLWGPAVGVEVRF